MTTRSPVTNVLGILAAVVLVGALIAAGLGSLGTPDDPDSGGSPTPASSAAPPTAAPTRSDGVDPGSGLPIVSLAELPVEAADAVLLIDQSGPFPYRQDGATFENREGLLPDRSTGYYREYTVETPGSDDRGARRIVVGQDGEMYWTADHYDSFAWIAR
jgi:ribonuclease T1